MTVDEKEVIQFSGHSIVVKRRPYQKRLGVAVRPTGEVRVSANRTLSQRQILKFLEKHKAWIETSLGEVAKLQQKYPKKQLMPEEKYPYLGEDYNLKIFKGEKLKIEFCNSELHFYIREYENELNSEKRLFYFKLLKKNYREVAKQLMEQRVEFWSHQMQLFPSSVHFRGQKTIWGSCTPENKINLNFKLIVAPIEVIDYVIIHELAHIRHKNHSRSFWSLVEQFTEYRQFSKQWLGEHQYKADFLSKKSELRA